MLPYEIVKGKDSAIRQKISYCDLGIFKCLNISLSRESSQPTTFFHFSLESLQTVDQDQQNVRRCNCKGITLYVFLSMFFLIILMC